MWTLVAVAAVEFTLSAGSFVIVPVGVDGGAPMPFLVDTGSARTTISETLATTLRAPVVGISLVVTAAGSELRQIVRVTRLDIGGKTFENIDALVVPAARLDGGRVHGIVAQDLLATDNFSIDYRRRRLTLGAPDERDDDTRGPRLPLRKFDGRYLVELPQDHSEVALRYVPDSAAAAVVVFESPGGPRLSMKWLGTDTLTTLVGERVVDRARLRCLRVGAVVLKDAAAIVIPKSTADEAGGDGLLPLHLFDRVTFNVRDGYLTVGR